MEAESRKPYSEYQQCFDLQIIFELRKKTSSLFRLFPKKKTPDLTGFPVDSYLHLNEICHKYSPAFPWLTHGAYCVALPSQHDACLVTKVRNRDLLLPHRCIWMQPSPLFYSLFFSSFHLPPRCWSVVFSYLQGSRIGSRPWEMLAYLWQYLFSISIFDSEAKSSIVR